MSSSTRHPVYPMVQQTTNPDNTQRLNLVGAWSSNNVWSSYARRPTSQRDTAVSRGSDELSPTAQAGSAHMNARGESGTWNGLTIGGWRNTTSPNEVSPTNITETASYNQPQDSRVDNPPFATRQSFSHDMTLPPQQTLPPSGEDRTGSNMYGAPGTSQYFRDAFGFLRRDSEEAGSISRSRPGVLPSRLSRQSEASTSRQMTDQRLSWGVRGHDDAYQRIAPPGGSVSIATDSLIEAFSNLHAQVNLEQSFDKSLALEDNTRAPFSGSHRGSAEKSSPANGSYLRNMNSPRNLSRNDFWSRPVPRNSITPHDLDKQQQNAQYANPPSELYQPFFYPSPPGLVQDHNPRSQLPTPQLDYRQQLPVVPSYSFGTTRNGDPTQGARSALLEEFRSLHRTKRYELRDLSGHIVEFCGDQHGSRFIQDKLKVANSEEKERVFQEIMQNAVQLMKDVFGNYVIQRFFEHGDQVQKKLLAGAMMGRLTELSTQMYSCRVVQKALEHVLVDQQIGIIEELRLDILQVAKNANGNHVVQKIVSMFPERCIPFIMEAFKGQVEYLASHQYACRIIQRIFEHGTEDEKKRLMADIHVCAAKLMIDQYGNYVIQHIIEKGQPEDQSIMMQHVIDKTLALSRHKYASNVVEKCIQYGSAGNRNAIRSELTARSSDGTSPLQAMIRDQYGNYVVQKLLAHLDGSDRVDFALELKTYVPQLKKQGTGRHTSALERFISAIDAVLNPSNPRVNTNEGSTTTASTPSTPNLAVEVGSTVLTPSLTTEQNTPQSSSPPSTNISTADECSEETDTKE